MKRRILTAVSLFLVVFLLSGMMLAGCSKDDETPGTTTTGDSPQTTKKGDTATTEEPTEAEEEPTELFIFARERWAGYTTDTYVMNRIQEETNTKWRIQPGSDLSTELTTLFMSNDIPDIFNMWGDDTYERGLVEDGILLPINQYFDKAPNLEKSKAGKWDLFKHPDGNVYSLNASFAPMEVSFVPFYRKDWLDKLGLKVPETIDEYVEVARAVTDDDPDGNNEDDTYAIGVGDNDSRYYQLLFSSFGTLPGIYFPDEDGNLVYGSTIPNMREALRFINKLFDMGVFDPEFITDNAGRVKEKYVAGKYGACCLPTQIFDENNLNNYYQPFKDANPDAEIATGPILKGSEYYREDFGLQKLSPRGWLRTGVYAETENIDAVMRVLDYLSSEEGLMLTNYGEEGVDYVIEDGVVRYYINSERQQERGLTQCNLAFEYLFLDTSKQFQDVMNAANAKGVYNAVDGIFVEEAQLYQHDVEDYLKTQQLRIITGDVPVDEGFEQLLSEWERRGGKKLLEAYREAYNAKIGR